MSRADAERFEAFGRELDAVADVLRGLVLRQPPNVVEGSAAAASPSSAAAAALGRELGRLSMPERRALLDLFTSSAADYLEGWFEADLVKALFGFDADRRQLREPLHARHRLCAAPSRLRRGERPQGRLGPRDRRHGRDHAGHGALRAGRRASRSRPARRCARCSSSAAAPLGVRARGRRAIRARAVAANVNPKLLYTRLVADASAARRLPRADAALALRLRHVPDERRALRAAELHCLPGRARRGPPHRRHHHRAEPRLHGPRLSGRAAARLEPGADRRDADPVDPRRQPRAARARTSPACFASTSPPSCRTAAPGTTTARRSPT